MLRLRSSSARGSGRQYTFTCGRWGGIPMISMRLMSKVTRRSMMSEHTNYHCGRYRVAKLVQLIYMYILCYIRKSAI